MNCSICNSNMSLVFMAKGQYEGKSIWVCDESHKCDYTDPYVVKFSGLYSRKGMGTAFIELLKQSDDKGKSDLLTDIKAQMFEILKHYVSCRVGGCYTSILRYILIDYLEDPIVLDYFLKFKSIQQKGNIILSITGAKIYYDLYYDLMLVKNNRIKEYLIKEFPEYYSMFQSRILPGEQYSFIDYNRNEVIEVEEK